MVNTQMKASLYAILFIYGKKFHVICNVESLVQIRQQINFNALVA